MIHKIVKKPLMPNRGMPFSFKERELATHFSHEEQEKHGSQVSLCNVRGQKKIPESYGKEKLTTVAAFLPWRGLPVHSP